MKELQLGNNIRYNFSNRKEVLEIPNLNDIQIDSYKRLERERLEYIFSNYFPVTDDDQEIEFRYNGFFFDEPEVSFLDEIEYKNRGLNYTRPLKIKIQLYDLVNQKVIEEKNTFLCNLPVITEQGTFIINGVERVIVSQLVRSPDLYVTKEKDKQSQEEKIIGQIMPERGTRLSTEMRSPQNIFSGQLDIANQIRNELTDLEKKEIKDFYFDDEKLLKYNVKGELRTTRRFIADTKKEIRKNQIKFQFDSSKKVSLLTFLYSIGLTEENIVSVMGDNRIVRDNILVEENPNFNSAINTLINYQIINGVSLDVESNLDYKKDIENIIDNIESRGHKINEELDDYLTSLSNDQLIEIVINSLEDGYPEEILKLFDFCKSFGISEEVTLIKKNEHSYRQKRKIYEDLMEKISGRGYNFGRVGRYKFNMKADLIKNISMTINSRIYGLRLAEDLVSQTDKNLKLESGAVLEGDNLTILSEILKSGTGIYEERIYNKDVGIDEKITLQRIYVHNPSNDEKMNIIGIVDSDDEKMSLELEDILAYVNYLIGQAYGIGKIDDKDHLGNRRVRLVGELVEQEISRGLYEIERKIRRYGFTTIKSENVENKIARSFITTPFNTNIQSFFSSSQLSQFMDQTNPLAMLTHLRRLSALGPGGISRERATMEVRDVHTTHYGRICPIESPEGGNVGLISSVTVYAKINEKGFLETPYVKLDKKYDKDGNFITSYATGGIEYISAIEEDCYIVGQSTVDIDEETKEVKTKLIPSRFNGDNNIRHLELIDYIEISPKQIFSAATGLIPFLEHDDAKRALMGANMQRQAVPLMISESPIVGTSMEYYIGKDSSSVIRSKVNGTVKKVNSKKIIVEDENKEDHEHKLIKYMRTNQSTIMNHSANAYVGQNVKAGEVIADGNSIENGELALGKNATVAFMTWDGYNYEDAIIISDRLVKEDVYTSIHIEEYECQVIQTKIGLSQITRDIPNVGEDAKKHLDENGLIIPGTRVEAGDILVGKVVPKAKTQPTPEERLLYDILGEKSRDVKDESLRIEHGGGGIVQKVLVYDAEKDHLDVSSEVKQVVKVYVAQKRKIQEGDKVAGRHGNKGVISKILPQEDMPYMEDGTPVDIMLNPLGVPSRMNIGQVLEMHLGMIGKILGVKFATEIFEGLEEKELVQLLEKANISKDGKFPLYDGRTGEKFDYDVTVGVMYIMKLSHMVEDKMHARSIGPYALVTQQPLGGKAQFGGQRFGEMEVWALEAYGAANTLQEMLTLKSDDIFGRSKMYESILRDKEFDDVIIPESYNVLLNEIQGLGIDLGMYDKNEKEIRLTDIIEY